MIAVLAQPAGAQTSRSDPVDTQAWYGGALRLDLPRRWRSALEYRLRMVDNASQVRGSYVTAGLSRRVTGPLTLLGSYRLALVDNGTFHRFAFGAEADRRAGDNKVALRGMVQYQRQNFDDNDEVRSDEDMFLRTRLEYTRRLGSRLDAYASTEPYFALEGARGIDNWRNTFGLELEYARGRRIDLFYVYRPDYAKASYNRTFHIVGIDLEFDVKVGGRRATARN
jgi:hypothetical protein